MDAWASNRKKIGRYFEMVKYVCQVCGYTVEGERPAKCPQCGADGSKFDEVQSGARVWADEHKIGVAQGLDEEVVNGLRENFMGECTEVGMYLAMARQADREGYPEVAGDLQRAAFEEAEHASKFAELLAKLFTQTQRRTCSSRADAECGATAGKLALAKRAKELGYDAIHDTVHEMAKDEARHGCASRACSKSCEIKNKKHGAMEFRAFFMFYLCGRKALLFSLRVLLTNPCIELLHLAYHETATMTAEPTSATGPA